jgi:hypothetical protein
VSRPSEHESDRRRRARVRAGAAAAVIVVAVGAGAGAYAWQSRGEDPAPVETSAEEPRHPVRVEPPEPLPAEPAPVRPAVKTSAAPRSRRPPAPAPAEPSVTASAPVGRPVVWVQAGHEPPGEPGYKVQTGASSGPFGGEIAFTTRVAAVVERRLRAAGVDARHTPALVIPLAAPGASFVSLHHDTPEGRANIGHAISGAGENFYRGEGLGTASPTPYPDSAPHRRATVVDQAVERRSRGLAERIAKRYRVVFTSANGARSSFAGVEPRTGNPRMMRFYGYYRTNADARVLIEFGAGGTDDTILARTDLIGTAVARGIVDDLRARGLLARR